MEEVFVKAFLEAGSVCPVTDHVAILLWIAVDFFIEDLVHRTGIENRADITPADLAVVIRGTP
jgi:hypothetical protein